MFLKPAPGTRQVLQGGAQYPRRFGLGEVEAVNTMQGLEQNPRGNSIHRVAIPICSRGHIPEGHGTGYLNGYPVPCASDGFRSIDDP